MVKVSVIIPCYNVEDYLRECLDSIINQTLTDIEIICINDDSTDTTLKILKEYAKKDNRIIILNQNNKGSGIARNLGIKEAKGEFVAFMDSDDFYPDNDILETLYTKIKEHNVKICGGSFFHLIDNEIKSNFSDTFYGYHFDKEEIINYKKWQFDYGYHRFLYEKDFLIKNNLYYPNYRRYQDPPFFVKAMYMSKEFYAIPKLTYLLRCEHKTINWTKDKKLDLLNGIKDNLNFAKEHNLEKLYYLTCERLNQHSYVFVFSDLFNLQLIKFLKSLNYEIIYKYNPNFKLSSKFNFYKLFLQELFSLKNDNNHKVITILGIKVRIKRRGKNNAKS